MNTPSAEYVSSPNVQSRRILTSSNCVPLALALSVGWILGVVFFTILLRLAIVPFGVVGNSHFSHLAQLIIIASLEGSFIGAAFAAAFFVKRRVGYPLMLTLPIAWVAQEWARSVFPWGGFPVGIPWLRCRPRSTPHPIRRVHRSLWGIRASRCGRRLHLPVIERGAIASRRNPNRLPRACPPLRRIDLRHLEDPSA